MAHWLFFNLSQWILELDSPIVFRDQKQQFVIFTVAMGVTFIAPNNPSVSSIPFDLLNATLLLSLSHVEMDVLLLYSNGFKYTVNCLS